MLQDCPLTSKAVFKRRRWAAIMDTLLNQRVQQENGQRKIKITLVPLDLHLVAPTISQWVEQMDHTIATYRPFVRNRKSYWPLFRYCLELSLGN